MSGHSKWANIKHRKASQDAKKANVFTKIAKDITIAAKNGGGDPESNFHLRLMIDKARAVNMPNEKVERAVKRGTGELKDAANIEEVMYEAYGPGSVAMLIKSVTDNKNRALGEVRNILNKNGGKIVEGGGVAWQFEQVGSLVVSKGELRDEELEIVILESGAKDYQARDGRYFVFTPAKELKLVKDKLSLAGAVIEEAGLIYRAKNQVAIDQETRADYERLLEALDGSDDVSEVYDNIE